MQAILEVENVTKVYKRYAKPISRLWIMFRSKFSRRSGWF